ncbi:cysteine dioxygenase [Nocardioides zeicaulis]|uniref:Cysteine dioxygenase family protein n=1 Tax=Nocardioides zeicaulis TaxID=1776857 RepID=A0ABV6DZL8_9ACTN
MPATFPTSYPAPVATRPRPRLRGVAPSPAIGRDGTSSRTARAALAHHLGHADPLAGVDRTVPERTWERVGTADGAELWLITWPPDSGTGWHDHGSASGAFVVLEGALTEHVWTGVATATTLPPHLVREFGSSHVHDVVNTGTGTAVSLHAYAPSLAAMTRYEVVRGRLQVTSVEQRGELW